MPWISIISIEFGAYYPYVGRHLIEWETMAAKLGKQKTRYNLADVIRYSMNVPCN